MSQNEAFVAELPTNKWPGMNLYVSFEDAYVMPDNRDHRQFGQEKEKNRIMNRSINPRSRKTRVRPHGVFLTALMFLLMLSSCSNFSGNKQQAGFNYGHFKDSLLGIDRENVCDDGNCFDDESFVPGRDSANSLFDGFESVWKDEQSALAKSTLPIQKAIEINLVALRSFRYGFRNPGSSSCRREECPLYAEVDKSKQEMHVYVNGELVDTYPVSTGVKGRETPSFSVRPSGPIFTKYTSTKFPGGNYKGLGNMPYAVFVKGGYAIHGTTPGNFRKLGGRASHGCIRLHPENAKVFSNLVREIGLQNTWVTVK